MENEKTTLGEVLMMTVMVIVIIGLVLGILVGCFFGLKAVGRYQDRADRNQSRTQARYDANNEVAVNAIRIRTYEQKVKIASQQANIRFVDATGVRRAQDEIAKTLTPLYVQFEMIDALKAVAESGRNATVVYIPTGSNGLPIVNTTDATKPTATPSK